MSILVPVLAVTFAAFCVWLTVRIVNRRERWEKWTLAGLAVTVFVSYPLSYPWAQAAFMNAAMKAATRGEQLPNWIDEAGTRFYTPLGWAISITPDFVLEPFQSYNEWSLKKSGIDVEHIIQSK